MKWSKRILSFESSLTRSLFVVAMSLGLLAGCSEEHLTSLVQANIAPNLPKAQLHIINYCPRTNYSYVDMWAIAYSYEIQGGQVLLDTDHDGIPDIYDFEASLGITPDNANSTGIYGDLVIYRAGITVDQQPALYIRPCPNATLDTDGDGLTDCEENNVLHTDPTKWDPVGDHIPKYLKVRFGLNPKDFNEAQQNPSGDGIPNIQKIKLNLPIDEQVNDSIMALAFKYEITPLTDPGSQGCYDLKISNVPITKVTGGNLIKFYFFEHSDSLNLDAMRVIPILLEEYPAAADGWSKIDYTSFTTGDAAVWHVQ